MAPTSPLAPARKKPGDLGAGWQPAGALGCCGSCPGGAAPELRSINTVPGRGGFNLHFTYWCLLCYFQYGNLILQGAGLGGPGACGYLTTPGVTPVSLSALHTDAPGSPWPARPQVWARVGGSGGHREPSMPRPVLLPLHGLLPRRRPASPFSMALLA